MELINKNNDQSIFDVLLQNGGALSGLFDFMHDNNLTVLDIPAGEYVTPEVLKQDVVDYFAKLKAKQGFIPVSSNTFLLGAGAVKHMLRHDFVSGTTTSYCGKALLGSNESGSVWTISKIVVSEDGTTNVTSATGVAWTDRYTVTYI